MTRAYYNEHDPFVAAWLRNLIAAGHIASGDVDERSIEDVTPTELAGYTQCHFFAGIGAWSAALRAAGWPDDRPVWTGSCPCQPFSAAGKGGGFADERHLWPAWFHLIEQCRPSIVLGEQVASKDGLGWLDLVSADMEGAGYAFGASDLCAAGVGAPHIRQRLYYAAVQMEHAAGDGRVERRTEPGRRGVVGERGVSGVAYASGERRDGQQIRLQPRAPRQASAETARGGEPGRMADAERREWGREIDLRGFQRDDGAQKSGAAAEFTGYRDGGGLADADAGGPAGDGPTNGYWRNADWLLCRDAKWRPVSSKPQPMVDGSAESLGRVCDEDTAKIEEEINAWSVESKISRDQALRDLFICYAAEARSKWAVGRIPGLCEAPFLLAFMRQLAAQGWREPQCLSLSCAETSEAVLRSMWVTEGITGAPRQYGLEGQQARKYSDALLVLSSLLARRAQKAWGIAYEAYAETQHPLTHGAACRVGRLRAYGNAISLPVAQAFIEAVIDSLRLGDLSGMPEHGG